MASTIQQALHGYSDGHRLIAGSLKLTSADARIMLVMSDLSGGGVKPDPQGYLTGYPLDDLGKYVLARTWAAPEMPRPGCVWTHSLLIDNADLAALTTAEGLLACFRRPALPVYRVEYSSELLIEDLPYAQIPAHMDRAEDILNAIYAAPDRQILVKTDETGDDEGIATAIWMQQWPRLRRTFGFCTLSGMDRSAKGVALDLQIANLPDRHHRSKFPGALVPSETSREGLLEALTKDLAGLDRTKIRDFLRRTGGDVEGGRRAMIPLCRLHAALFTAGRPNLSEAVAALGELDSLGPRSARSVRTLVLQRAMDEIGRIDDEVFEFVLESIEQSSSPEQTVIGTGFGRKFWLRSPDRFASVIASESIAGRACREALLEMPLADILPTLISRPSLARTVVALRHDLLERADFWRISDVADDLVQFVVEGSAPLVAQALIAAGRVGPASVIIDLANPAELIVALESTEADPEITSVWLQAFVRQPNRLASALSSGRIRRMTTLVALARAGEPDDSPNDYGEDPWIIALRSASGVLNEIDLDFLVAFMISRALGSRSQSKAELFRFGYERLYRALQHSRMPYEVERLVISRLDWGSWLDREKCSRLRETVVRHFVEYHLDPETFGRLADDGALAISLIDEAARSSRGRRYLIEVRDRLKHINEKGMKARYNHITNKI